MADIIGTDANDSLTGTDKSDSIDGLGGDDFIDGGKGADTIQGGVGNDTVYGGLGADLIMGGDGDDTLISGLRGGYGSSEPGNTLEGGAGNDRLSLHQGDTADGGSGLDSFSLSFAKSDIAGAEFDLRGLDKHGTATFLGTSLSNVETGTLSTTTGDDTVLIGTALLQVNGMEGNDHITIKGGAGASGGDGDDLISGGGKSNGFDGGLGNDTLIGGGGQDYMTGGGGDDRLVGGKDALTMLGGGDNDVLVAKSADSLYGGGGADSFQLISLAGADSQIFDLDSHDTIDLRKIDADVNTAGNQAFNLVGAFDGHAAQAVLEVSGGNTFLHLDVDGDGAADATLTINGDHAGFESFLL